MKTYLIFVLNKNKLINNLIKAISDNFNIELSTLKKSDFIKSNETYICKNNNLTTKILNFKKDFKNDVINQILYFKTKSKYINFLNIIKSDNKTVLKNSSKNYFIPKYFNNPDYNDYYIIEFNIIDYIKYIKNFKYFEKELNKLNNLNKLIINYNVKEYESNYVKLNVFCDIENNDNFIDLFYYINNKLNINDEDYVEDYYKVNVEINNNVYIIIDEEVNRIIDKNIDDIKKLLNDEYVNYSYTQIKVQKKYLNKFIIDYRSIEDIYEYYKSYNKNNIKLENIIKNEDDIDINNDWDFILKYHDYNSDRLDKYFMIYSDYIDKINFIK